MVIEDSKQLVRGLEIIETILENSKNDVFVNIDALGDVLCFLGDYIKTHKVEINNALDKINNNITI